MPGVEILANELDTLMTGDWIREVPRSVSTALFIISAVIGSAVAAHVRGAQSLRLAAALCVVLWGVTFAAFDAANVWIHALPLSSALALGYVGRCVDSAKLQRTTVVA
jgi:CHASE2 domain-containing sensor protein